MTTDLNVRDKKVQVTVQVHQIVRRRKSLREVMAIEVHLNNVWKGTVTQEFENLMVPSLRKRVLTIKLDFSCRRELKPAEDITPEERDARTAFCMQLARNIRPRDLEEFFSKVGQVSHFCKPWPVFMHSLIFYFCNWVFEQCYFQVADVRIISDRNSRRSKGIAYVEFTDRSAVPLVRFCKAFIASLALM